MAKYMLKAASVCSDLNVKNDFSYHKSFSPSTFFLPGLMEATTRSRRRVRMMLQAGASSDRRRTIDSCISRLTEEDSPQDRPFIALLCPPALRGEERNVRRGKRCRNN